MPYRRSFRSRRSWKPYYHRRSYRKKGVFPRSKHQFGKPARPELKHVVTQFTGPSSQVDNNAYTQLCGPCNISQGLDNIAMRVGNRISLKFCNFKMLFTRNNATGAVVRYVIWRHKNPTSAIVGPAALSLTPTSLINTQDVHIIRQGYVNLNKYESTIKSVNINCRNMVCDFKDSAQSQPVTTHRWYLTVVNTDSAAVSLSMMNKCYYADA